MTPVRDFCLFDRVTEIPPKFPVKRGFRPCYEQMAKFRCDWWVSGKDADGRYAETGPFPSYDAARRFAGRQ